MRTRRWIAIAVLALLACGPATAPMADEPQRLVVGVEKIDYLPVYALVDGEYRGFARELLDAFAADRGYDLRYRPLPVARLYASFFRGSVDLKFPDNPRWRTRQRRGHDLQYSAPLVSYIDGSLVPPEDKGQPPEAIDRLGTVTGFTPWAWLDAIRAGGVTLSENSSFTALLRQALSGRVDAAYASVAVANYQLEHVLDRPGGLVFDPGLPHTQGQYHLSTIRHPEVLAELDAWLGDNRDRVEGLKARHGVEPGVR